MKTAKNWNSINPETLSSLRVFRTLSFHGMKVSKGRKMEIVSRILIVCIFIISFGACDNVVEPNIENKTVVLLSPPDNHFSSDFSPTFYWEELEGATAYQLQIVSPNFSNITTLVLDSTVTNNSFTVELTPGTYSWRVRAVNGSSETNYKTRTLTVDSTPDLSNQQIVISTPTNAFATSSSSVIFTWLELSNADDYRFEMRTPDFDGQLVLNPVILEETSLEVTDLQEGEYEWGVRGQNTFTNTAFTKRTLTVDQTNPGNPILQLPVANDSIEKSELNFSWSRPSDSGSAIQDSFIVASDSLNQTIVISEVAISSNLTVDSLSLFSGNNYWWKVKSVDAAQNSSSYTSLRRFYLK